MLVDLTTAPTVMRERLKDPSLVDDAVKAAGRLAVPLGGDRQTGALFLSSLGEAYEVLGVLEGRRDSLTRASGDRPPS
ncbi:DUF6302 family protein [Streptomyces sp. NBC_00239]|uniref:DUF6302 family protein n=1 Tax=Streptomyces sp. NBC_00239 TaxID=2903640 RepID=UPI002E27FEB8|nr:DUF6302 family protein [Streptomyces sp. NBC_00239]